MNCQKNVTHDRNIGGKEVSHTKSSNYDNWEAANLTNSRMQIDSVLPP